MRTLDVIDAELRLLVVIRRAAREAGGRPSTAAVDELLDERLSVGHDASNQTGDVDQLVE